MLLGEPHCGFAVFTHQTRRKVLFRSIDSCSFCWLCRWGRYWMLQDMDNIEASCLFYVQVGTFTHLEQSKIANLTVNKLGIVRLTVQHDLIVSISFMYYPRAYLGQTSADILSLEQCPIYIWQSCDFGFCTPQCIVENNQATSHWCIAHHGAVGNPCNVKLCTAGFILTIPNMLAATYSILPCG